ncbi:hypothetical protein OAJ74_00830 [Alphaproteobacteria bacterium]|nr:hypothetical protein [Alphaproteobacteria bacterium]
MSVARVTTINFKTKESADELVQSYTDNAPSEFPEAKQLLQIRVDDTTVMAVSLYENNEAMERASAARTKRMDSKKDNFASVDTKVGTVELNHLN